MDIADLYESALPRLMRIAAGLGLAPADAEDALHDSYVALLQNRARFDGLADANRWLARVMVNRCLLHHRKRGRRNRLAPRWASWRKTSPGETDEVRQIVRQCLRELSGDELAVLVLRYFCEFNATEIGEALGLPPATVRSRLRQARMELAERLIAKGVVDDVP